MSSTTPVTQSAGSDDVSARLVDRGVDDVLAARERGATATLQRIVAESDWLRRGRMLD